MSHSRTAPLPVPDLYTVAEAANVAEMDTKAINRELDAHVVHPAIHAGQHPAGRLLGKPSLLYLAAVRDIRTAIDTKTRTAISQRVNRAVARAEGTVAFGNFQLPLKRLARTLQPRLDLVDALRGAFEIKPNVAGGEPVVRGTRVKAHMLADMIRRGVPASEIAREYQLTKDTVELAVLYDSLYPRRGRPPAQRYDVRDHPGFPN